MVKNFMKIFDDITLVYVSYNSDSLFQKNIDIINKFNTVIIDNSNSLNLKNYLINYPKINYIKTPVNLGFGSAMNLGVKNASTPYVLLLNPDINFTIESIDILYQAFISYPNSGTAGPSLYTADHVRRSNSSLSYIKKKIYRNNFSRNIYKKIDKNLSEGSLSCDYIIGCAMLFKKEFFLKINGFDENFFMYFEDNDICDRIKKEKKLILEIPKSKMSHLQGMSTKPSFKLNSILSIIHKISEYKYLKKNISIFKLFLILLINALDFFQRLVVNLFLLKFKNFFTNLLRLISIFLYITGIHSLIKFLK